MKIKKILIGLLAPIGLIVIILLSAILISPYLLESKNIRAQALSILSNWTGGDIKINGPIKIKYFLGAQLDAEDIEIVGKDQNSPIQSVSIKSMSAGISWLSLLKGKIRINKLALQTPKILTKNNPLIDTSTSFKTYNSHPLAKLIRRAAVKNIEINNGYIEFSLFNKNHKIEKIYTNLNLGKRFGKIQGKGHFYWKNKKNNYLINTSRQNLHTQTSSKALNIYLDLSNPLFNIQLNGLLDITTKLVFDGYHNLNIQNLSKVSNLFGISFPSDIGIESLKTTSKIAYRDNKLIYDKGTFSLDGNKADGTLVLELGEKPKLDGSLALSNLSLMPYIPVKKETVLNKTSLPVSLMQFFELLDMDLIISTDHISMPNFTTGFGVIAISINSNNLSADIAEIELCDGQANGLIEIQNKTGEPSLSVHGYFKDISTDHCINEAFPNNILQGKASAEFNLSATGKSWSEGVKSKWTLNMPKGGSLYINVPQMIKAENNNTQKDLQKFTKATAEFDNLSISLDMIDSTARINSMVSIKNAKSYRGYGKLNLKNKKLNYTVSAIKKNNSDTRLLSDNTLNISGSLITPYIALY